MAGELYFNRGFWLRKFDNDEQAVKFLELLFNRAGGAQAPDVNLIQLGDMVTNLEGEMDIYRSRIRKLERRINELENGQ